MTAASDSLGLVGKAGGYVLVRKSKFAVCFLAAVFACGLDSAARGQGESKPSPSNPVPAVKRKADAPRSKHAQETERLPSRYPRRFDTRRQFSRNQRGYRFGAPSFEQAHDESVERAYRQGILDGRDSERFDIQAQRGLSSYRHAMLKGHGAFDAGKYGLAARQFLLAATLNQGDPAARLCAAHAQIALKDYPPAARLLHRAFELQPKLVFLPMDIRGAYRVKGDFAKHRGMLQKAAAGAEDDVDLWFLLGYVHYYTDRMAAAASALKTAADLDPGDRLITELLSLAAMSAPADKRSRGRE